VTKNTGLEDPKISCSRPLKGEEFTNPGGRISVEWSGDTNGGAEFTQASILTNQTGSLQQRKSFAVSGSQYSLSKSYYFPEPGAYKVRTRHEFASGGFEPSSNTTVVVDPGTEIGRGSDQKFDAGSFTSTNVDVAGDRLSVSESALSNGVTGSYSREIGNLEDLEKVRGEFSFASDFNFQRTQDNGTFIQDFGSGFNFFNDNTWIYEPNTTHPYKIATSQQAILQSKEASLNRSDWSLKCQPNLGSGGQVDDVLRVNGTYYAYAYKTDILKSDTRC